MNQVQFGGETFSKRVHHLGSETEVNQILLALVVSRLDMKMAHFILQAVAASVYP